MNKKGFTLIELLVVIAIIGLLTGIIVANISTVRAKNNYSSMLSQLRQIRIAADNYFSDNGTYPADTGPGSMPAGLSSYISGGAWPKPPCPNLTYDWNYFTGGTNVNIDVRTISPAASQYFFCIYALPGTTCGPGVGTDLLTITSRQIVCQ